MNKLFISVFLGMMILSSFSARSQEAGSKYKTAGFFTGYGVELNPGINYKVHYIGGDFSFSFKKAPLSNFLSWYLEPQFNIVRTDRTDIEFGSNIGLRYHIRIGGGSYCYQMIGSGPHYISAELERQSTGFIFSDNLAVGILKSFSPAHPLLLNLQLRYRHISNASLKQPNSGIDNLNLILGLTWKK